MIIAPLLLAIAGFLIVSRAHSIVMLPAGLCVGGNPARSRIFWYVAAAVYAIGAAGVFFGYKPPPRPWEKMRELDWLGC
ncbi:hypothetical protein INS49_007040 [Diaporthe citri]|uniref:uncharacterized protein n=1 Tax=Diaporthe citri TaxID=83186 RepID=UPI001C815C72|nr:uncharacterized protein INS49_007040 [Diaporthe citri]KAG6365429.1 hypothetical protein INS49_007040 [Diaporthe citri]